MTEGGPSRTSIIFVVSSLSIGGPQKSLVGLLQRLDPEVFNVHLAVLSDEVGQLRGSVPPSVKVLPATAIITAATLPRRRMPWAIFTIIVHLLTARKAILAARVLAFLAIAAIRGTPGQQVRQRTWELLNGSLPPFPGEYDLGLGILGLSTYALVDCVEAKFRYHWVRSDTRILDRDEDIEARYFETLDGALSVSSSCAEIFEDTYPFMRGRVRTYKNHIPVLNTEDEMPWSRIRNGDDGLRLLTVARLDPLKGLDLALDAASMLLSRGVDFTWLILGEGPERASLEQSIEERGLSEVFVLQGSVLDTSRFLETADIFVHPSRAEGRSNAVEEARFIGLPVLATCYPTVADQVKSGIDGLVCDMSGSAIADAIVHLANNPDERSQYSATAKAGYLDEQDDANRVFEQLALGKLTQKPNV